jgi:hypothetical protein
VAEVVVGVAMIGSSVSIGYYAAEGMYSDMDGLKNSRGGGSGKIVNKKGVEYPNVTDLKTGKPIEAPPDDLQVIPTEERVPWYMNKYEADRYRKSPDEILCKEDFIQEWYKRGFSDPSKDWKEYDIHHIVPREYGGQNTFENLTPVLRSVHQSQFNKWWLDY